MAKKPLMPKPMGPRGTAKPIPLPKRSANGIARKITAGSKVKTPRPKATPQPGMLTKKQISEKIPTLKKKPTLDDFLLKGKRPPMKIKPGLKRPSDADVILKGYNDKKYKGK